MPDGVPWHGRCDALSVIQRNLRSVLRPAVRRVALLARQHRHAFVALVIGLSLVTWTSVAAAVWFAQDVVTDLPDITALRGIGTLAQATTLVDVKGRAPFTIYQEQRID